VTSTRLSSGGAAAAGPGAPPEIGGCRHHSLQLARVDADAYPSAQRQQRATVPPLRAHPLASLPLGSLDLLRNLSSELLAFERRHLRDRLRRRRAAGIWSTNDLMRTAELELARQAETSYKRLVQDQQAGAPGRESGRERDTGARIDQALEGQVARQASELQTPAL
jgi:hypothetical protein